MTTLKSSKRFLKINDDIKKFELLNTIFLLSRGKEELFATAIERREYRVQKANSGNAYKRRKHIALDPKQKCILMTSQDKRENNTKRESSVYYILDYENETKRTWNTMMETTYWDYFSYEKTVPQIMLKSRARG